MQAETGSAVHHKVPVELLRRGPPGGKILVSMDTSRIRYGDLTPGPGPWRIAWMGEVSYHGPFRRYFNPSVRVEVVPAVGDPTAPCESQDPGVVRTVWMPLGALPRLRLGDVWEEGHFKDAPPYATERFSGVAITQITTAFVKAGLPIDGRFLLPLHVHPWHRRQTHSYCLCVQMKSGQRLIIPCLELIRFYFGSSSRLLRTLFRGPLEEDSLWESATYDDQTGHLHLKLASGLRGVSAPDVGRMALNRLAFAAAAKIHASCVKHSSQQVTVFPYTGFPFLGETTLEATGLWLPFGETPDQTFLVFQLLSCSYPFPFRSLSYETSESVTPAHADPSDKAQETRFSQKSRKDRARSVDDADPGPKRKERSARIGHKARFPDLTYKPIWKDNSDREGPGRLFFLDNGEVEELVGFGDSVSDGVARPLDYASSTVGGDAQPVSVDAPKRLPRFAQMVIDDLAKAWPNSRFAPVLIPGTSKLITTFPTVVDKDGVLSGICLFRYATGKTRLRRVCMLEDSSDHKALFVAAVEGKAPQKPHLQVVLPCNGFDKLLAEISKVEDY
ncbi:MAG: hypothetical protein FIA96_02325 [Betaproteobacteria bacterium]|nr:hypothetical protein [Betaproteobacteria bacterium]